MLRSLDLRVSEGEVIAVVGKVGSGKTALIECLLGEMLLVSGSTRESAISDSGVAYEGALADNATVRARCSLVTQKPWVREGSIRENITMIASSSQRITLMMQKVWHNATEAATSVGGGALPPHHTTSFGIVDEERYRYALWAACLLEDLAGMPAGDET